MSNLQFILDIVYSALMAGLYGAVAWAVSRRAVSTRTELANLAFQNWWAALSFVSLAGLLVAFLNRLELWSYPGYMAYFVFILVIIVIAIGSLMHYFVFLFTGNRRAVWAVLLGYNAFAIFLFYWLFLGEPQGLRYEDGVAVVDYARDLTNEPITMWVSILLLGPPVLGALAYMTLFFRVEDRTQKFRIITVGGSIFVWMLTALGGSIGGASESDLWYLIASRAVAVLATTANFIAFMPPKWLRERLGLRPGDAANGG